MCAVCVSEQSVVDGITKQSTCGICVTCPLTLLLLLSMLVSSPVSVPESISESMSVSVSVSVPVVTRPTSIYAALNCGLVLVHSTRLQQAADFFALALDLYRGHNYFRLHRLIRGHSCCAQHVLQHALELLLGPSPSVSPPQQQWQRHVASLTFHSRRDRQQQQQQHRTIAIAGGGRGSGGGGGAGAGAGTGGADEEGAAVSLGQNTSCLAPFPGLAAPDFVLLALPLREYLPSSTSYHPLSPPPSPLPAGGAAAAAPATAPHSKMLHYKGDEKQSRMVRDYRTSLDFDFTLRGDEERFRLRIAQVYSAPAGGAGAGAGGAANHTAPSDCLLPCCGAEEACQQPTLPTALAQCHRQLFKYRLIERYYRQRIESKAN